MDNKETKKHTPVELDDEILKDISGGADAHAVTCRNCGEIVPGGHTFCHNCGTQILAVVQPWWPSE